MTDTTTELVVRADRRDGADVLALRGELDLTNTHHLQAALDTTSEPHVVLDLALLTFVDSAALRAIDEAHRAFRASDRSLLVVAPPDSRAAWTFRVAGFGSELVLDSLEAALARS